MNKKWNESSLIEDSKQYDYKKDWIKNSYGAYLAASRLKILNKCCQHMIIVYKKRTTEEIINDAQKYNSRFEWFKESTHNYNTAVKRKILEICCKHMINKYKPKGYWSKEKLLEEAKLYKTKTEWNDKSSTSYNYASKLGNSFFNKCCKHMLKVGNKFKKLVYVYEFEDKTAYIGLTCNEEKRKNCHLGINKNQALKSPVYNYITSTGLIPKYKRLTIDYINFSKAQQIEKNQISIYKNNKWKLLNKNKGGALGGGRFWTNEKILSISKKFKSTKEWRQCSPNSYQAAIKYNIKDECCKFMIISQKKWTKEKIFLDAQKYKSKSEWQKKSSSAYLTALRKGYINECSKHMKILQRAPWTKEELLLDSKKYNSKSQWKNNSSGYTAARKMKILNECCVHMQKIKK